MITLKKFSKQFLKHIQPMIFLIIIFDVASLASTRRENATYFLNLTKYFKIYFKRKATKLKSESKCDKKRFGYTWQPVASHGLPSS
jgi:hypothetical protein